VSILSIGCYIIFFSSKQRKYNKVQHHYCIHIKDNILKEEFCGDIDLATLDRASLSIIEDKNFKKGLHFLTDLRKAHLHITYDEMWQHTSQLPDLGINKQALIVSRDLEYGFARQFHALSNDKDIFNELRIFKDINEAHKWLNL